MEKLKCLKASLKVWNKQVFGNLQRSKSMGHKERDANLGLFHTSVKNIGRGNDILAHKVG